MTLTVVRDDDRMDCRTKRQIDVHCQCHDGSDEVATMVVEAVDGDDDGDDRTSRRQQQRPQRLRQSQLRLRLISDDDRDPDVAVVVVVVGVDVDVVAGDDGMVVCHLG